MTEFAKNSIGFLIYCVAVAILILAFWGGIALVEVHGASQTCARTGGHWVATDKPVSVAGGDGESVIRSRECRRG